MNIVSETLELVTTIVESTAATNAAKVAQAISPTFFAAIALYVIYLIFEITYAQRDVLMSEVTKNIGAFALVGAFTYSAPYYSQFVIPFVMHAGADLSAAITGDAGTATSVDNLWDSLSKSLDGFLLQRMSQLSMTDVSGYLLSFTIYIIGYLGGMILIYYTAIFLCLSTFMVGILLSAGILFICFSLFASTRNMFTAWVGSCLNYILLNLFYTISFSFLLSFITQHINISQTPSLFDAVTILLVIAISVFLIEQVGTLCSTLTGGVGINGLTSAANGFAGKLAAVTGVRALSNAGGNLAKTTAGNLTRAAGSKATDMLFHRNGKLKAG
ncbi:TPA: type IV secretion system protein [Salmonella enterica subsp. enterica serovar Typhimurium]|nr:type IV secretion system protein [Salmonella enterica subsp. enterica serovar Typhimurium]